MGKEEVAEELFRGHPMRYWIGCLRLPSGPDGGFSVRHSLVEIGEPAVMPLIAELKRGEASAVDAATLLGRIGDVRAVEPLIAAINDKFYLTGNNAIESLGIIGDRRAVKPLIRVVNRAVKCKWNKDDKGNRRIRAALCAIEALGEIGDERAVQPLASALKRGDPVMAKHIGTALLKLQS